MIYICEYDYSVSAEILQKYASQLPIPAYDGPTEGAGWQKRRERILAWLLLQHAAGEEKFRGVSSFLPLDSHREVTIFKSLDIQRTRWGKPYSAANPDMHFNISHCDRACACIIGDVPCGVDIEKKFTMRENLIRKICHAEEYAVLEQLSAEEREQQLRFLWSMKESFVKMDGRGLGYGMDAVNLAALLPVKSGELNFRDGTGYLVQESGGYTLAGCVQRKKEISVHVCSEAEMLEELQRRCQKEISSPTKAEKSME